ncbi:MAG: hypothetical protein A2X86_16060 [Bdellovibrionales bacterium GWA2_49_15]|nr:MAG: hypothetical protein A2X86_16060 [Bdellovibrionales bacterium GWA2_49_15]HAZ13199.1 hypothetical protein [Bdellovibrionales bacterium]
MNKTMVSNLLHEKKDFQVSTLVKIANALGKSSRPRFIVVASWPLRSGDSQFSRIYEKYLPQARSRVKIPAMQLASI